MIKNILVFSILLSSAISLQARIDLPSIFSNNMIIQRDKPIKIWGNCSHEESIVVSFNGDYKNAPIKNGYFEVIFDPIGAGGPYQIQILGSVIIAIEDVLIGDVFVVGGQSNMEWPTGQINNFETELLDSDFPKLRFYKVPHATSSRKKDNLSGPMWKLSNPGNAAIFSAIGFLYGRNIHKKYKIPIGIIDNSWGGTDIKGWLPEEAFVGFPEYLKQIEEYKKSENLVNNSGEVLEEWKENMDLKDLGNYGGWGFPTVNKADWKSAELPGLWEDNGYADYDGIMWYAKKFNAPIQNIDTCLLSLGKIDDNDLVYINGMAVGSTSGYSKERKYLLPKSVLFETDNQIVIRIKDTGGYGGLWSKPEEMYCECGQNKISLSGLWKIKKGTPNYPKAPKFFEANAFPTNRYNAMVHPLTNFQIKGYLYYQGESDVDRHKQYGELFSRLIRLYRTNWGNYQMPFMFVQLANFGERTTATNPTSNWASIREAQASVLSLPYTGMATAIDVGEGNNIHPRDKQSVANRLTTIAQNLCYNEQIPSTNPKLKEVLLKEINTVIRFSNVGSGLKRASYTKSINGFIVLDANNVWTKTNARILSTNSISLNIEFKPKEIKYLWEDNPEDINLYNSESLPVLPFSWKK